MAVAGAVGGVMMGAALYGCVVVPQFAAQAMLRLRPKLGGGPTVVMEGKRPHEAVFSVSAAARALGVRAGMTRVEVETFGAVAMLARSHAEEEAAQGILLEAMARFTPRAEQRVAVSRGLAWECLLDLTGSERLLGSAQTIGEQVVAQLRSLGFVGHIALCANADAGLSFARDAAAWQRQGASVRVIPAETMVHALAPLPLDVLGLDAEQQERFTTWGIATLGELAALPEVQLITRMGQAGKQLRLRARGELPHLLQPAEEPLALREVMELEEPVETLEPLLFCVNPMLEQILLRAQQHALALAAVTITLWLQRNADRTLGEEEGQARVAAVPIATVGSGSVASAQAKAAESKGKAYPEIALRTSAPQHPRKELPLAERVEKYGRMSKPAVRAEAQRIHVEAIPAANPLPAILRAAVSRDESFARTIRPAVATLDQALLLKMLKLDLEAHPPPGAVVRVLLTAEPGDMSRIQLGLFVPPMPEPTRFEDTHARLISIVGETNVGRVKALDTHARDNFTLERFTLPGALTRRPEPRAEDSQPTVAFRRLNPPQPVRVVLLQPERRHIQSFYFGGHRYNVLRCYGPWRASGDWWQPTVWSADTWDVAARAVTKDGEPEAELLLGVIAHDLVHGDWTLEGFYD